MGGRAGHGAGQPRGHDRGRFFRSWIRHPKHVGAIMPSSRALGRLMAAQLDPERHGTVIELGGGTGAITREILAAGIAPQRLLVLERDDHFHRLLRERFPGVSVIQGDAAALGDVVKGQAIERVNAVVSGLPMLNFPGDLQNAILKGAFEQMDDDGLFVQFTYSPAPPISRTRLAVLGLKAERAGRVWFNVPPATVWRFRRLRYENTDKGKKSPSLTSDVGRQSLGDADMSAWECRPTTSDTSSDSRPTCRSALARDTR